MKDMAWLLNLNVVLLILGVVVVPNSNGIDVAYFQMDGFFTEESFMNHTLGVGDKNLSDFTLCMRQKLNYLRGRTTFSFSLSNGLSDNALTVALYKNVGTTDLTLGVCKYRYWEQECAFVEVPDVIHQEWHHLCFVITSKSYGFGQIRSTMKLYYDGKMAKEEHVTMEKGKYRTLLPFGSLVLGQEQDGILYGGFFDKEQAFSGQISQAEMWNVPLTHADIEKIAKCQVASVQPESRVVTWRSEVWKDHGITIENIDLNELCMESPVLDKYIWPDVISLIDFKTMCTKLDGEIPLITDNRHGFSTQEEDLSKESMKVFRQLNTELYGIPTSNNSAEGCFISENRAVFWLAGKRKPDGETWFNPYDPSTDMSNYVATGPPSAKCSYLFGGRVETLACESKFACGYCYLPKNKLVYMKGLCAEDIENLYDTEYYIHGTRDGRPYFKGTTKSHIFFNRTNEKWFLQSLLRPEKFIFTHVKLPVEVPIGTHVWEVGAENALCDKATEFTTELTFSQCFPNKYTCNSGHCIPLSDKCNTEIDCADKSDEYNCDYLRFGDNYAKELIPRDTSGKPVIVYMNASVLAFPFIETVNLKFTADFFLNLRWYDLRIDFRDLNNVTSLNSLSYSDRDAIWAPRLGFTNALGPFQTVMDALSSGVLVREDNPLPEDITLSTEAMLFSGATNSIYLTREYYQEYACPFDLTYYPFDTQMCQMIFEVQGKTDNYIRLAKDGNGVEFLASRTLVEYEIQQEDLEISSKNNISRASLKFVFRRRMEYHVTNTFMQTFILVLVGYLSFYFDVRNFTDRIMVVLTTMLVIATIMSSIQTNLPKTSYYKLIDWWLLLSLNILVVTMAFHTYLAHVVSKARDQPFNLFSGSTILKKVRGISPVKSLKRMESNKEDWTTDEEDEKALVYSKRLNKCARVSFAIFGLSFNLVFWTVALVEYVRPAEEYFNKAQ